MSEPLKKGEVAMWNHVRVELPPEENVFTPRELEGAIKYAKERYPNATEGLPDNTHVVISREMIEGHQMVWAAGVSRSSIAPHKPVIYNDDEREGLRELLRKVCLFLPEFKRRYCDPRR